MSTEEAASGVEAEMVELNKSADDVEQSKEAPSGNEDGDKEEEGKDEGEEEDEEEEPPLIVKAKIYINQLQKIDSSEETFEVDFWLHLHIPDPHLQEVKNPEQVERDDWDDPEWFDPKIEITNHKGLELQPGNTWVAEGHVVREWRGVGACAEDLDLHDFPFDIHKFHIAVESTYHSTDFLRFVVHDPDFPKYNKICETHSEFEVLKSEAHTRAHAYEFLASDPDGFAFHRYQLDLWVARRPRFYVVKIGVVYFICIVMSFGAHLMSVEDIGDRVSLITTMFLTVVAFQFAIGDSLPKISYMTTFDYFVLGVYMLLLLQGIESTLMYHLTLKEYYEPEDLFWIDYITGMANAFIFLLLLLWLLWLYIKQRRKTNRLAVPRGSVAYPRVSESLAKGMTFA